MISIWEQSCVLRNEDAIYTNTHPYSELYTSSVYISAPNSTILIPILHCVSAAALNIELVNIELNLGVFIFLRVSLLLAITNVFLLLIKWSVYSIVIQLFLCVAIKAWRLFLSLRSLMLILAPWLKLLKRMLCSSEYYFCNLRCKVY